MGSHIPSYTQAYIPLNDQLCARYLKEMSNTNRPEAQGFIEMKRGEGLKSSSRRILALALQRLDADTRGKPWNAIDHTDAAHLMTTMREQRFLLAP